MLRLSNSLLSYYCFHLMSVSLTSIFYCTSCRCLKASWYNESSPDFKCYPIKLPAENRFHVPYNSFLFLIQFPSPCNPAFFLLPLKTFTPYCSTQTNGTCSAPPSTSLFQFRFKPARFACKPISPFLSLPSFSFGIESSAPSREDKRSLSHETGM